CARHHIVGAADYFDYW
nr:immunoglobulin heavy chain junction region [Macaca mulatta]MPN69885.1 immunoglobulin heavy chain junction region [Macaca mulatta]MPN69971.1 immunoglobulin heavy chain junction region [Macaca mulatta]MPN69973.1 immunoglobulin heavy chain junction region [Macaca mulatta]MPN69992.1 immunoglobulin heavy chain junction region [Macaca mulatta]